ncbi:CHAT domain-containing protein [Nostoc sp. FACHB-973]|nr:CHAT domain-containing protein [Nostoc sp. FACHB-973]MBX9254881.1 CHAT domain-containing protein [Desmonostoc muscorum CCALA 125]
MRYRKLSLTALITLILTISQPIANLPILFQPSQVLAQSTNSKAQADRLFQQGIEQYQTSQFEAALQSWQQALIIYREIKDRKSEGKALDNLGVAYYALGDYNKAIEYHSSSLAIAREIKDRKSEGNALGNLGVAYYALGDYPKAIDYQQQRLVITQEIQDRLGEGQSLGNLGLVHYSLGNYSKAIEYQQQRLVITQEIQDHLGEGNALGNLGLVYYRLGDYKKAIEYLEQVLVSKREIKDRIGEGKTLGNLSVAYYSLENYSKAVEYQQQYLAIAREIKDRLGEATALGNLGLAYYFLGDYSKAIEYPQQSLAIAREIKNRLGKSTAVGILGLVYSSLGDYSKAIEYQQQYLAIAREIKDRLGEGTALNNLGFTLYKSGNLPAAEKILYEGIKVYESLRDQKLSDINKVFLFDTQKSTYRILQQVLITQNKIDAALEIAERGRARVFVEFILSTVKEKQISPKPPTIAEIKQIAKSQNATLVQYSIIQDKFKVIDKEQTKESELYIWVIKPTGEVTFRKADLKLLWQKENTTLAKLVTTSRQSIGVRGRGGVLVSQDTDVPIAKQRFRQLHELLISPIADLLPKKESEKVVFIPQNQLFLIPFSALQDEEGKYLIDKHTILTAPSIQVLNLTHQQRVGNRELGVGSREVLVVGNPTTAKIPITNENLIPLPGAEFEAVQIADLFKTQAIIGSKATETAIVQKMSKARIIHFATHGLLDDFKGFGVPGAIALAPSPKDDGFLTSGEILDMKLNAELVVLSACNTGGGNITGDGVIGLSRSLITAGVPSVIVSLWSVDDKSTASLMSEFYRNLQQNPDKAVALRQAMLTTKKLYSNPLDWAAFTLIGESD